MMHEVIDDPALALGAHHPVRLFIGSGMPAGLWRRVTEKFDPAHVVEFFATTDGEAVLANVSGTKVGSKGRPLPGGGKVRLAAYDPVEDVIIEGEDGFVQIAEPGEVGLLLAKPPGDVDPTAAVRRGVFAPGDTWVSSEFLFRRDEDGDFWMLDGRGTAIRTAHGVVYAEATSNALGALGAIDLVATYPVETGETTVAVTAVVLRPGEALSPHGPGGGIRRCRDFRTAGHHQGRTQSAVECLLPPVDHPPARFRVTEAGTSDLAS